VSPDLVVDGMRAGWLTLAFMMLLSRVVFQAAGAARMRAFLDGWQRGGVKRIWGATTLAFALFLVAAAIAAPAELRTTDAIFLAALLGVLVADGLVNALPAGFETFKDRLQRAWISRTRGTRRGTDSYLFATVNALLAAASMGVAATVILYRPIRVELITIAAGAAIVLTAALISASVFTAPPRNSPGAIT
jgi:hypothetical protein